jgi:hypothetical protein
MIARVLLALLLSSGVDGRAPIGPGPRLETARVGVDIPAPDTVRVRRKAVQLSEAYEFRAKVHKMASYAILPLFVAEYASGDQLLKKGSDAAPAWASGYHGFGAGAIAALFGVNTLTGALNWYETRGQADGRAWRTAHSVLMLLADAGFVATGAMAGDDGGDRGYPAGNSTDQRRKHRNMAVASMSVAAVSYVMMLKPLRRD